ncbi:eukaryotic translation initiation factor-like [Denticeps clupeoides]|uniref:eukaryotic translation initiation factor-like n=1 Tax=Denticeps clupeoides TaxID=299321 RepID=UPI0010A513E9|nr:eukaryotic translation initiation factor-like [Denticeps clupeoides]XP_028851614.1 eukaryotic translation initiation factor-like [Denticeps clupeoides]XP_028851615.1 eukaryotic translation initiation factor-like [Denticeps clupeoides]
MSAPPRDQFGLHRAEKPWRPKRMMATRGLVSGTRRLLLHLRTALNKITERNFHRQVEKVVALNITTKERLLLVVDAVLTKAVTEPKFSGVYAQLCADLQRLRVPGADATFAGLLLSRVWREFRGEPGRAGGAPQRQLGLVRFIAELFKVNLVAETIVHSGIQRLLQDPTAASLECLCGLLPRVCHALERSRVERYLQEVEEFVGPRRRRRTSFQLRFRLQDTLDECSLRLRRQEKAVSRELPVEGRRLWAMDGEQESVSREVKAVSRERPVEGRPLWAMDGEQESVSRERPVEGRRLWAMDGEQESVSREVKAVSRERPVEGRRMWAMDGEQESVSREVKAVSRERPVEGRRMWAMDGEQESVSREVKVVSRERPVEGRRMWAMDGEQESVSREVKVVSRERPVEGRRLCAMDEVELVRRPVKARLGPRTAPCCV